MEYFQFWNTHSHTLHTVHHTLWCVERQRGVQKNKQVLSLYLVFVRRSREGSLYYPLVFELSEREGALQCILEPLEAGLQTRRGWIKLFDRLDQVGRLD